MCCDKFFTTAVNIYTAVIKNMLRNICGTAVNGTAVKQTSIGWTKEFCEDLTWNLRDNKP